MGIDTLAYSVDRVIKQSVAPGCGQQVCQFMENQTKAQRFGCALLLKGT
ncbi:hypothetical protein GCE9029_01429 [Grimontia celer]|uniref:Uncharacterized protein n=1 Tax=Grimontia celer TaxID=1796497 RepID=A0A128EXS2_9GAMM|nr:hypothetical protein [Grimontia celer]CZF79383.1 hypothetical protein GCE9029_01429 [Grimontia celer]